MRSNAPIASLITLLLSAVVSLAGSASALAGEAMDSKPEFKETLFFALPEHLEPGFHVVETTVLVNGSEIRRDSLLIPAPVAGTSPAVELFALHPEAVSELLAAARAANDSVILQVALDDQILATQPIEEMVQQSLELRRRGFTPVDVVPRNPPDSADVRRLVAASGATCEADCWDDFDQCVERCGNPTDPECEDRCENDRDLCLENCEECPSVREYQEQQITNQVPVGPSTCLEDHLFFGTGKVYVRSLRTVKVTQYRETTECDGTVTTEVLSVHFVNFHCWQRTSTSCAPFGPNFGFFLCL